MNGLGNWGTAAGLFLNRNAGGVPLGEETAISSHASV
jgi:hypothetical protein